MHPRPQGLLEFVMIQATQHFSSTFFESTFWFEWQNIQRSLASVICQSTKKPSNNGKNRTWSFSLLLGTNVKLNFDRLWKCCPQRPIFVILQKKRIRCLWKRPFFKCYNPKISRDMYLKRSKFRFSHLKKSTI